MDQQRERVTVPPSLERGSLFSEVVGGPLMIWKRLTSMICTFWKPVRLSYMALNFFVVAGCVRNSLQFMSRMIYPTRFASGISKLSSFVIYALWYWLRKMPGADMMCHLTATFQWTKAATLGTAPAPRDSHTCSSYRNTFIVLGGEDSSNSYLSDIYVLDAGKFFVVFTLIYPLTLIESVPYNRQSIECYMRLCTPCVSVSWWRGSYNLFVTQRATLTKFCFSIFERVPFWM